MQTLFTEGALVDVHPEERTGRRDSVGGRAWVKKVVPGSTPTTAPSYSVEYIVDKLNSHQVKQDRLADTCMLPTARLSLNNLDQTGQSLLAPQQHRRSGAQRRLLPPPPPPRPPTPPLDPNINTTNKLLRMHMGWKPSLTPSNPVVAYLKSMNTKKNAGWLRKAEATAAGRVLLDRKTQLTAPEKNLMANLYTHIKNVTDTSTALVAHAWGVLPRTVRRIVERMVESTDLSVARKVRADAGKNIFNSDKRRQSTYTPRFCFLQKKRRENPGERLTTEELDSAWRNASPQTKAVANHEAQKLLQRGPHLVNEVYDVLSKTNGCITWRQLTTQVSGGDGQVRPFSEKTLREFVMGLPDSSYTSTRIFPLLDKQSTERRYNWAKAFWIFWNTATSLRQEVQFVLVHMDEKWFYAIVTRRNNKYIPFMGIEPVNHSCHHKSHIYKVMGICSTGFAPIDNDMTKGGRTEKVSLVRVGKMLPAAKDTFKRVYRPDGSFHYPKIPENMLRQKGELYFKPLEVTGCNEGTAADPKFSLKKFFEETEIPKLEAVAARLEAATSKRIVIRYQMDGAGPHKDGRLTDYLASKFEARGWILKFQPANSPITNVKDACIFPAMSKRVTEAQGLSKGSHVLEGEELWSLVTDCYHNLPPETIARAYVGHHQMVNAIAQAQGRDDFARKLGGLHCGIRNCCIPYFDSDNATTPCGVEVVQSLETDTTEVMERKKLKYPTPDVSALKMEDYLSVQELGVLFDCFERFQPESDKWMPVATALSVLTFPSEGNNSDEQTQADDNEQTEADEGGALVSSAL